MKGEHKMAIWITSDFHFNHSKPFIYEPRGFSSPDEMNKIIIDNFNELVKPEDDVYVLGDLMLGGAENHEKGLGLISWLNGKLHIIRGNHDSDKRWEAYQTLNNVVECKTAMFLKYEKYHFYLSHFPCICSNYDDKGLKHSTINLCGHSHTKDKWQDIDKGIIYHCELDAHDNKPILLDNIIEDLKEYYKLIKVEEKKIIAPRCDKCVYLKETCSQTDKDGQCWKYRRDPPDGGYYG